MMVTITEADVAAGKCALQVGVTMGILEKCWQGLS